MPTFYISSNKMYTEAQKKEIFFFTQADKYTGFFFHLYNLTRLFFVFSLIYSKD